MLSSPQTAHEQKLMPKSASAAELMSYPLLEAKKGYSDALQMKKNIPIVLEYIAACESGGRQFHDNGNVVRGEINSQDVGKYQINISYWKPEAEKQGYDIFTEEGNEDMALFLFGKYSAEPWESSKSCWEKRLIARAQ